MSDYGDALKRVRLWAEHGLRSELSDLVVAVSHIYALEARVAVLEAALRSLVAHCAEAERLIDEEMYHVDHCGESLPLCSARAALGEQ